MANKTQFTRKELFDLVWSKPLSVLAKEYDISDNGLRKICKKYNIPLPQGGHWQKVKFGKKHTQQSYVPDEKLENVTIELSEKEDENSHVLSRVARLTKEIEKTHPDLVVVKDRLSNPDILIQDAQADLNSKKVHKLWGFEECISTSQDVLSVTATKDNVSRALRFMDAFIKLMKKRGHNVEILYQKTTVTIHNQLYRVSLREKHVRQINTDRYLPSSFLIPTGVLTLKLDSSNPLEWKDGKTPLEKQLAKIVAALEIRADVDNIKKVKQQIYQEECDRLEAIKNEEKAALAWEKEKVSRLIQHSQKWNEARQLENFIQAVQNQNAELKNEEVENWINWANRQLINLDPLSGGPLQLLTRYNHSRESEEQDLILPFSSE
ncbi:MAG: hypothetical protein ACO1O6_13715 [Bacteroidota bacterium]